RENCSGKFLSVEVDDPELVAGVQPSICRSRRRTGGRAIADFGYTRAHGGLRMAVPRVPQAGVRVVVTCVGTVCRPTRGDRCVPVHARIGTALLASGLHRVDGARRARDRAGVLRQIPATTLAHNRGSVPTGMVLLRSLPSRSVYTRFGPDGAVPVVRDSVDGSRVLSLRAQHALDRRD